jgi:hypothetical protein
MSEWLPREKATILIPSGPVHDPSRLHLHIILTNPIGEPPTVLVVPVESIEDAGIYHDPSCYLLYQDHEFITHKSYVNYRRANLRNAEILVEGITKGVLFTRPDVMPEIFDRVCHGLVTSDQTPQYLNNFYCNRPD